MDELVYVSDVRDVALSMATDVTEFILTSDMLPSFHQWMLGKEGILPGYTQEMMRSDMETVLAALKGQPHPRVEYRHDN
jgi:hypothetical protein